MVDSKLAKSRERRKMTFAAEVLQQFRANYTRSKHIQMN